jgi:RluA family pseudouridine synthase
VAEDLSPLALLHEDEDVVAVAKPSGQAVIAARGEPRSLSLQSQVESRLRRRVWVVHRIDRDASGVVLFALNADAHRALSLSFEHRQVVKTYTAFVAGTVAPRGGRVEVPLHAARRGKTRPAVPGEPGALPSVTEYATRTRWNLIPDGRRFVSLLDVHPLTGRHHQIRVHLHSLGAPILFDPLYGRGLMPDALARPPCARLALHALRIDVPAPRGGRRLVLDAPLAADLAALAGWLDTVFGKGDTAD